MRWLFTCETLTWSGSLMPAGQISTGGSTSPRADSPRLRRRSRSSASQDLAPLSPELLWSRADLGWTAFTKDVTPSALSLGVCVFCRGPIDGAFATSSSPGRGSLCTSCSDRERQALQVHPANVRTLKRKTNPFSESTQTRAALWCRPCPSRHRAMRVLLLAAAALTTGRHQHHRSMSKPELVCHQVASSCMARLEFFQIMNPQLGPLE